MTSVDIKWRSREPRPGSRAQGQAVRNQGEEGEEGGTEVHMEEVVEEGEEAS